MTSYYLMLYVEVRCVYVHCLLTCCFMILNQLEDWMLAAPWCRQTFERRLNPLPLGFLIRRENGYWNAVMVNCGVWKKSSKNKHKDSNKANTRVTRPDHLTFWTTRSDWLTRHAWPVWQQLGLMCSSSIILNTSAGVHAPINWHIVKYTGPSATFDTRPVVDLLTRLYKTICHDCHVPMAEPHPSWGNASGFTGEAHMGSPSGRLGGLFQQEATTPMDDRESRSSNLSRFTWLGMRICQCQTAIAALPTTPSTMNSWPWIHWTSGVMLRRRVMVTGCSSAKHLREVWSGTMRPKWSLSFARPNFATWLRRASGRQAGSATLWVETPGGPGPNQESTALALKMRSINVGMAHAA